MPVISKTRSRAACLLLLSALGSSSVAGCALFGSHAESTVARGQYYASGDPYYDEFFVDLYLLQVGMAEAPKLPESERQRLVQLLQLEPQATPAIIEQHLHEEALKLSRAGVHLRLDQIQVTAGAEAASTAIRSNARPKENPAAALLASIESASGNLLRWKLTMKQKEEALNRLELMTIRLDANVDHTFSQAPVGKVSEVKGNLADAHKLIPLMRARAERVRAATEQLLAALTFGINTDDGSIGPPLTSEPAKNEGAQEVGKAPESTKSAAKPRPKARAASGAPAPAARPRPASTGDGDEPAKPRAPSNKPTPPARDFEP